MTKNRIMKAINLVLLLLLCPLFLAADSYYHSVKAVKGDGIYSLLRRYQLNDHNCNRQQFLELNEDVDQ